MRDVRFQLCSATGPREAPWTHAALDEFLIWSSVFRISLQKAGVIPPLSVINEVMASGCHDAGMSGSTKWKPFQISQEEYEELVESLMTNPNFAITEDRELWDRSGFGKWHGAVLSKYGRKGRNRE